jgi:hypothetical protein
VVVVGDDVVVGRIDSRVVVLGPVAGVGVVVMTEGEVVEGLLQPVRARTPTARIARARWFTAALDWSPFDSTRQ